MWVVCYPLTEFIVHCTSSLLLLYNNSQSNKHKHTCTRVAHKRHKHTCTRVIESTKRHDWTTPCLSHNNHWCRMILHQSSHPIHWQGLIYFYCGVITLIKTYYGINMYMMMNTNCSLFCSSLLWLLTILCSLKTHLSMSCFSFKWLLNICSIACGEELIW